MLWVPITSALYTYIYIYIISISPVSPHHVPISSSVSIIDGTQGPATGGGPESFDIVVGPRTNRDALGEANQMGWVFNPLWKNHGKTMEQPWKNHGKAAIQWNLS